MIVYGEFSCPYSYLASSRVDALAEVGVEVDWRAVEHAPLRPVSQRSVDIELEREFSELLLPGEELRWRPPGFVPNTDAAVAGYAEARGAGVAGEVRRVLFAAYWVDGADIGNPEVLRRRLAGPILRGHSTSWPLHDFGYAVSPSGGPVTTGAWRRMQRWRQQWARLEAQNTPALLLPADNHAGNRAGDEDGDQAVNGGQVLNGVAALRHLSDEIARLGAPLSPHLPDPDSYLTLPRRPSWW